MVTRRPWGSPFKSPELSFLRCKMGVTGDCPPCGCEAELMTSHTVGLIEHLAEDRSLRNCIIISAVSPKTQQQTSGHCAGEGLRTRVKPGSKPRKKVQWRPQVQIFGLCLPLRCPERKRPLIGNLRECWIINSPGLDQPAEDRGPQDNSVEEQTLPQEDWTFLNRPLLLVGTGVKM